MAVNITEIQTKEWSSNISSYGEVVTNIEDIRQSIYLILSTVPGSLTLENEFGCGLFEYVDEPALVAAPKIAREIRTAIKRWEQRVTVSDVSYTITGDSTFFRIGILPVSYSNLNPEKVSSYFMGIEISGGDVFLVDQYNRRILTEFGVIKM